MQRTRRYRLLTATLLVLAASAAAAPQGEYYGSGYTIISQEHGNDDLQATVYRQLTPGTVGQALPQLLDGTGWRLADRYAADDRIYRLYNQPLPEHKLRIGPMPLDQALGWIAGDGWALVVDPVNRLVSFEVEARYDSRPPVGIHSRPAATSHVPEVAPAAAPVVYADLPPQGSFPAVQAAPDYTNTTYRTPTAAYPVPPREDWQNALPQRLADNDHVPQPPREQRRSKTRKALRPAVTASGNDSAAAAVPHQTAASNRSAAATAQKTATPAAAPATKTTSAKTSATAPDKAANESAAKAAAPESRPATAQHSATSDKTDKKTAAPTENKTPPEGNKTATPATTTAEKTPAPAGHKKAAEANPADSPATAKPATDATAKPVPAATQPAAPAKAAPAPAKSEAPAPVLANPAKADGTAPAAAKPATAQDTAAQAKPAATPENPATTPVKTRYLPSPPPALIAKRTIHVPPQQRLRPPAAKVPRGETAASMTPPAAPAAAVTPEDAP